MPQSRKQREADDKWMQSAAMFFAVLAAAVVAIKTRNIGAAVGVFVLVLVALGVLLASAGRLGTWRLARSGMDQIDQMTGEQFESYLRALFSQKGYVASLTPNGADFGADLILEKGSVRTVVQAKQWRKRDAGVKAVQEVTGAKGYYHADRTLVVITGSFTKQAIDLAKANGVELWDRHRLAQEVRTTTPPPPLDGRSVASEPAPSLAPAPSALSPVPACPRCGQGMVQRTNRQDGTHFWGCPRYPSCRGTRPA